MPGLTKAIEVMEAATPLTNLRYTSNYRGAIYGWDQTLENSMPRRLGQKTPVSGPLSRRRLDPTGRRLRGRHPQRAPMLRRDYERLVQDRLTRSGESFLFSLIEDGAKKNIMSPSARPERN